LGEHTLSGISAKNEISPALFGMFDAQKGVLSYRRGLRQLARRFYDERLDRAGFLLEANKLIGFEFNSAFERGLERAGLSKSAMTEEEVSLVNKYADDETIYIGDVADDISELKSKNASLDTVRTRLERYVNRLDYVEDLGFAMGAKNKSLMWLYNPLKEHCSTCLKLNGRVYRGSQWAKSGFIPRSPKLKCFGIYCGCRLVATNEPVTRGRMPFLP
jgi:hypothetical protein